MSLFHTSTQEVDTILLTDASKKGTWCSDSTGLETSHVCIEGLDWSREKLSKLGERMLSNDLGNGEISLLSLWQTLYT